MRSTEWKNVLLLVALLAAVAAFTYAFLMRAGTTVHDESSGEFQQQTDQLLDRLKVERANQPGPLPPPTPEQLNTPGQ